VRAVQWKLLSWLGLAVVVLVVVRTGAALLEHRPVTDVPFGVAGLITAVWAGTRAKDAAAVADRRRRGAQAEDTVVAALTRAGVTLVVNGVELDAGGDADHVVVHERAPGTGAVAVVETKAGGGTVRVHGQSLATGKAGRVIPGDPIGQALRQAGALARKTGLPVTAVVCVPGMTNRPFWERGAVVCGARDLGAVVTRTLPVQALGTWTAQRFAQFLHLKR